jgi:integrase
VSLRDAGRSSGTLNQRFKGFAVFFRWALAEGEIQRSPLANAKRPKVNEPEIRTLTSEEVSRLLAACEGTSFIDRRDRALIAFMFDSGVRSAECLTLTVNDVNLAHGTATSRPARRAAAVPSTSSTRRHSTWTDTSGRVRG